MQENTLQSSCNNF